MPAEFLREVVGSRDASRPARRFWMLPLSIAAHAACALAVVIIPLAAEGDLPTPAPLAGPAYMKAQPIPAPPDRARSAPSTSSSPAAPTQAPEVIARERDVESPGPSRPDLPDGGIGLSNGIVGGFGTVMAPVVPPELPAPAVKQGPVRAGGGLVREPKRIVDVAPVYPVIARNAHVDGTVILEAVINEQGSVERIRILKSVPLLDGAAVDAVKQWRYSPTLLNGVPVSVLLTITVRFTLSR